MAAGQRLAAVLEHVACFSTRTLGPWIMWESAFVRNISGVLAIVRLVGSRCCAPLPSSRRPTGNGSNDVLGSAPGELSDPPRSVAQGGSFSGCLRRPASLSARCLFLPTQNVELFGTSCEEPSRHLTTIGRTIGQRPPRARGPQKFRTRRRARDLRQPTFPWNRARVRQLARRQALPPGRRYPGAQRHARRQGQERKAATATRRA